MRCQLLLINFVQLCADETLSATLCQHVTLWVQRLRLLSLQDSRDDQANWTENCAPKDTFPSIDKKSDDPEYDCADDDEFHGVSLSGDGAEGDSSALFIGWLAGPNYSPDCTPSALRVALSGAPVVGSPFCSWNMRMASREPLPHTPSGVPASNPPAFSKVWMAR